MSTRKELIAAYKQNRQPMGVYQIKNLVNGKVFLEGSLNLNSINGARMSLKFGSHINKQLQQEWNSFGGDNFCIEILETITPDEDPFRNYKDELKLLLEAWFEKLEPYEEKGYHTRKNR